MANKAADKDPGAATAQALPQEPETVFDLTTMRGSRDSAVQVVNRLLMQIENEIAQFGDIGPKRARWLACAKTDLERGFRYLNDVIEDAPQVIGVRR